MSYAAIAGLFASAPCECEGGLFPHCPGEPGEQQYISGDECCPSKSWDNHAYHLVRGHASLRYLNEQRVRKTFAYLLSAWPDIGNPVDNFAYDNNASAQPGLLDRIRRAQRIFDIKYPLSRWTRKDKCIKDDTGCTDWRYCWVDTSPPAGLAPNSFTAIYPDDDVVGRVIYGKSRTWHSRMPKSKDSPEYYLQIVNGQIVPKPWLENILQTFRPKLKKGVRFGIKKPRRDLRTLVMKPKVPVMSSEQTQPLVERTTETSNKTLLVVGLLGVAGAALLFLRRS